MNFEDEFSDQWKAPPIEPGASIGILKARTPIYDVGLDAGAMRAVWELVEMEAKRKYPTRESMAGAAAFVRAVEAFRNSFWHGNEAYAARHAPPPPPKRSFTKTVATGKSTTNSSAPAKKKRVFTDTVKAADPVPRRSFKK